MALLRLRERSRVFYQCIIPCLRSSAVQGGLHRAVGLLLTATLLALAAPTAPAATHQTTVAVAANFLPTAMLIVREFERAHRGRVRLSSGSTGKLYAQIVNGAPYDVFLSADADRPRLLDEAGHALAHSRFTYAQGRLAVVAASGVQIEPEQLLRGRMFRRLALANPKLAPYGFAARETLVALKLWRSTRQQRAMAENVGQVWAMFATGNVELAIVALAQLRASNLAAVPAYWLVPAALHAPIRQDAVQLARSADNDVATGFVEFLRTPAARTLIRQAGYELPGS
jgi:molybdate transport system substrate-binding protein